jgi:hypothetical protein
MGSIPVREEWHVSPLLDFGLKHNKQDTIKLQYETTHTIPQHMNTMYVESASTDICMKLKPKQVHGVFYHKI